MASSCCWPCVRWNESAWRGCCRSTRGSWQPGLAATAATGAELKQALQQRPVIHAWRGSQLPGSRAVMASSAVRGKMTSVPSYSENPHEAAVCRMAMCRSAFGSSAMYFVTFARSRYCAVCPCPANASALSPRPSLGNRTRHTGPDFENYSIRILRDQFLLGLATTFVDRVSERRPNVGHERPRKICRV